MPVEIRELVIENPSAPEPERQPAAPEPPQPDVARVLAGLRRAAAVRQDRLRAD